MKNWQIDETVIKSTLLHHNDLILNSSSSTHKIDTLSASLMLANYAVGAAYGEDRMTDELIEYKHQAMEHLKVPENAVQSAIAKVLRVNPPEEELEDEAKEAQGLADANNLNTIFEGL